MKKIKQETVRSLVMNYLIEEQIENLVVELQQCGDRFANIDVDDITFDASRAWSLSVRGSQFYLDINKFGAYRNYLGGGMRGGIEHNGRSQDDTVKAGQLFEKTLIAIENIINADYSDSEEWENPQVFYYRKPQSKRTHMNYWTRRKKNEEDKNNGGIKNG